MLYAADRPTRLSLLAIMKRVIFMCGYACVNCGRCRGETSAFAASMDRVPGYCTECGTLNGPSAKVCSACGASVDAAAVAKKAQDEYLNKH